MVVGGVVTVPVDDIVEGAVNPPVGVVIGWADTGEVGAALGESTPAPAPKGDTPQFAYNCE